MFLQTGHQNPEGKFAMAINVFHSLNKKFAIQENKMWLQPQKLFLLHWRIWRWVQVRWGHQHSQWCLTEWLCHQPFCEGPWASVWPLPAWWSPAWHGPCTWWSPAGCGCTHPRAPMAVTGTDPGSASSHPHSLSGYQNPGEMKSMLCVSDTQSNADCDCDAKWVTLGNYSLAGISAVSAWFRYFFILICIWISCTQEAGLLSQWCINAHIIVQCRAWSHCSNFHL